MTSSRVLSGGRLLPLRFRAQDPWRRIGVAFWVQHRRYLTAERLRRVARRHERLSWPGPEEALEAGVRYLVFRLRRPGSFERLKYRLDRDGDPDWEREPWRNLPGSAREAYRREAEARARLSERPCRPSPAGARSTVASRARARGRVPGVAPPSPLGSSTRTGQGPQRPATATHGLRGFVARLRSRLIKLWNPSQEASSELQAATSHGRAVR